MIGMMMMMPTKGTKMLEMKGTIRRRRRRKKTTTTTKRKRVRRVNRYT